MRVAIAHGSTLSLWLMLPYSPGVKALPLQPFSWQLSTDIDLENKQTKKQKPKKKEKCERRETK